MQEGERFERVAETLRGDRQPQPEAVALARWISATYSTDVVDVIADLIATDRPRLSVWLRSRDQVRAFLDIDGNYDPEKQRAIAERAQLKPTAYGLPRPPFWRRSRVEEVLVIFESFDSVARNKAVDLPLDQIESLRSRVANDALWDIKVAFGRVVFFVHTDLQAAGLAHGDEFRRWTKEFLAAAHERDEFGVLSHTPPVFELDSRERFDRDFQGNGYYYFL